MLLPLSEWELVHVALDEVVRAIEIQPLPISPGIDVKLQTAVLGLISQGLAIGISCCYGNAIGEAAIQFHLKTVIHRAVADIPQLRAGFSPTRQVLRLTLNIGSDRR